MTTGTGNYMAALAVANIQVLKWKAEIAKARFRFDDASILSAQELQRIQKTHHTHDVRAFVDTEAERIAVETGELASAALNDIDAGKRKALKNFIHAWVKHEERRNLKAKTIWQMKSDIGVLLQYLPTAHDLTSNNTRTWIKHIATKDKLSAASVTRIIGACKNFYRYLKSVEAVDSKSQIPFDVPNEFRLGKKRNSRALTKSSPWKPFESADVVRIYQHAMDSGDVSLGHLIFIGAYTGARIEEICSLKKSDVNVNARSMKITDSKTEAGIREIPIHSALMPLISILLTHNDDYLLGNLTLTKYGERSNALGKRFGRLKSKLGYSNRHVFHSIRKTFTTQLENASVLENITADILGHEKPRLTYGLYSGGTSLEVKRMAIENIRYDFNE
jgi:integrase